MLPPDIGQAVMLSYDKGVPKVTGLNQGYSIYAAMHPESRAHFLVAATPDGVLWPFVFAGREGEPMHRAPIRTVSGETEQKTEGLLHVLDTSYLSITFADGKYNCQLRIPGPGYKSQPWIQLRGEGVDKTINLETVLDTRPQPEKTRTRVPPPESPKRGRPRKNKQ